jgi:dihydrofolate synthase/folylpolyglutamate synthase
LTDALSYLFGLEKFGIKFGLDNIRKLTAALGDPQSAYTSVLIAGTNGKGSVTSMVETALRAAGHRTGRYTSPHLIRLNERMVVAGTPVSDAELADAAVLIRRTIEHLVANGTLATHPTFFEATTAIAFELFRRAGVRIAVLEVGLGGRFDSTNIVSPVVGAITSIDLDHEKYLGNTIPSIAFEKAGIVKPGMTLICGERKTDAVDVIRSACIERGATFTSAYDGIEATEARRGDRVVLTVTSDQHRYGEMVLALRGRHQARNAVVALRMLEEIARRGIDVPMEAIRTGLTEAQWRGRLDLVQADERRQVLLDAAHNPAGARELALHLREIYPDGLPIVFGVMKDKAMAEMLEALLPNATMLVVTEPGNPRAAPLAAVASAARRIAPDLTIVQEPVPAMALERAWQTAPTICASGSIFLVGELLKSLDDRAGGAE